MGSNVPATGSTIPVPDHVPDPVAALRLICGSPVQKGPAMEIVASAMAFMVTSTEAVSFGQAPGPETM